MPFTFWEKTRHSLNWEANDGRLKHQQLSVFDWWFDRRLLWILPTSTQTSTTTSYTCMVVRPHKSKFNLINVQANEMTEKGLYFNVYSDQLLGAAHYFHRNTISFKLSVWLVLFGKLTFGLSGYNLMRNKPLHRSYSFIRNIHSLYPDHDKEKTAHYFTCKICLKVESPDGIPICRYLIHTWYLKIDCGELLIAVEKTHRFYMHFFEELIVSL